MLKKIIMVSLLLLSVTGCSEKDNSLLGITMTESEICTNSGGFWNECGWACAGKNVDACIDVCVPQCECGFEDYKCMESLTCMQEQGTARGVCRLVE